MNINGYKLKMGGNPVMVYSQFWLAIVFMMVTAGLYYLVGLHVAQVGGWMDGKCSWEPRSKNVPAGGSPANNKEMEAAAE